MPTSPVTALQLIGAQGNLFLVPTPAKLTEDFRTLIYNMPETIAHRATTWHGSRKSPTLQLPHAIVNLPSQTSLTAPCLNNMQSTERDFPRAAAPMSGLAATDVATTIFFPFEFFPTR